MIFPFIAWFGFIFAYLRCHFHSCFSPELWFPWLSSQPQNSSFFFRRNLSKTEQIACFSVSVKICNGPLARPLLKVRAQVQAHRLTQGLGSAPFPKTAEVSPFFLTFRGCRDGPFHSLYSAGISLSLEYCLLEICCFK